MNILLIGGGVCGLGAALLLARDGHEVTVLERDNHPMPDSPTEAWESWDRSGVAQFRQPHNLMPGLRLLLERELPDIQEALPRAGASIFNMARPLPPFFSDQSPRPIDDQLWTYTARRPVFEWVVADAVRREPRITVRRGVRISGLLAGASALPGIPHVAGVRTTDGETLHADLVLDASGRTSRSSDWLQALGAQAPHEECEDSGFVYYTRYFGGANPPERRGPALMAIGSFSLLTLAGDNGTWSVTIFTAAGDQALKNLRHEAKWTSVVRACPLHAHWLAGEPISNILPMGGIVDRYRRFVVDGRPVATGFAAVADAWACTNPSAGRGLTVGFLHAVQVRNAIREAGGSPAELMQVIDQRTEASVTPWYRAQVAVDRARFAEMEALREGRTPETPSDELARSTLALLSTMVGDPDLFRAAIEYFGTITPVQEILQRPEVVARINAVREAMKDAPPPRLAGPDRQQLLALVG